MRKLLLTLAAALMLGVLLAACGSSGGSTSGGSSTTSGGSTAEEGNSGETAKAAYLTGSITDLDIVVKKKLEEVLGNEGGSLTVFNSEFNPATQLTQCQDAITSGRYNVLILKAVESAEGATCAKQAGAAGVKVIAIEIPLGPDINAVKPQLPEVQGSVVIDSTSGHEITWEVVEEACKGISKCQVALEQSLASLPYEVEKKETFERKAKEIGAEIVSITQANYEPNKTVENVPAVLAANPDLNVYAFEADTEALAAVPIVEELGLSKQVKLIGEGGSYLGAKGIEEGKIFGSTGTFPESMAEVAAEMAIEAVETGKVAEPAVEALSLGHPQVLTPKTIGEFTPQWGAKTE